MKALVCHQQGPYKNALKLETAWPRPSMLNEGEMIVQVVAAGLSFPDILRIEGKHVHPLGKTPIVPGREVSGIVLQSKSSSFKVGDYILGYADSGSWAEYVKVHEDDAYVFEPSHNFSLTHAAGFLGNYGTTWCAIVTKGKLKSHETILILGASGGVGLAAIDISKAIGARVIACASSEEKLQICKNAGADYVVNYSNPAEMRNIVESITGGRAPTNPAKPGGVDVVFDPVGGQWSEASIRLLRSEGRHLVIGFASGATTPKNAIPSIPLNLALLNERSLIGVLYGHYRSLHPKEDRDSIKEMLQLIKEQKLNPLIKSRPIEEWELCMDAVMTRKVVGKLVFQLQFSKL